MWVVKNNSYLVKMLFKHLFLNPTNVLFYIKNLILHFDNVPKEIRAYTCFMCKQKFVFPLTSKDYMTCNKCLKGLYG